METRGRTFEPPKGWTRIRTIESHTGGEPFRVVIDGVGEIPGETILARRRHAEEHLEPIRRALMLEPRGHADMYGCFLTPPVRPDSDMGILFMHNAGFSTMCGHGIIAMTTVAIETGMVAASAPATTVRFDTPAGLVIAQGHLGADGRVERVSFENVPSFVLALDRQADVPDWGPVRYDLAFGGAFYAYVDASSLGLRCVPEETQRLIAAGRAIKQAVMANEEIFHPFERDLGFLYGVIFVEPLEKDGVHSRNVCVFADGEVDRSPTGTGVSGRAALHHARGEITVGEEIRIESLTGSAFDVQVLRTSTFGPYPAVLPRVSGTAHLLGQSEFWIDPRDPLGNGFLLR